MATENKRIKPTLQMLSIVSGKSESFSEKEIKDIDLSSPRLEGYLHKRGQLNKLWKKRYFMLSNCMLLWFRQKGDVKAASSILLESCTVQSVSERQFGRKFCFQIHSTKFKRVYNIQAESYADRARWIEAISVAVESLNQRRENVASRASTREKEKDTITMFDSELEDVEGETKIPTKLGKLSTKDLQVMFGFSDDDRRKACIPSRYSLWRQPLAFDGFSSNRDHLLNSLELKNADCQHESSAFAMHNRFDMMVMAQGKQSNSQIQFLRREATCITVKGEITQLEGSTCLSWHNESLLTGSVSGCVRLYKTAAPSLLPVGPSAVQQYKAPSIQYGSTTPGRWMSQQRNNAVEINPYFSERFLSTRYNVVDVWDMSSPSSPLISQELQNHSPVFAAKWAAGSNDLFVLGGVSRSLKLYDLRSWSKKSQKPVWKVSDSHLGAIHALSWNPLMHHWFASGSDDGTIKIWDLRTSGEIRSPFRALQLNSDSVTSLDWSKSHCEKILSGCADGGVTLWNLRVPPHFVGHSHRALRGSAIGVSFSPTHPSVYAGAGEHGDVFCARMSNAFLKPFVQHRFEEEELSEIGSQNSLIEDERIVEEFLYYRDFEKAYDYLSKIARRLWKERDRDLPKKRLAQLVTLSSSTMFDSFAKSLPTRYSRLLRELSYYISPFALKSTDVLESSKSEISLLRLRLALLKLIEDEKFSDILSLEGDICAHLERDPDAIDMLTFKRMLKVVLPSEYLGGLRFSIKVANILRDKKRFNDFVDVAEMIFFPTIYHCGSTDFKLEPALAKKAINNLDRDLRNPKLVISQLELLYNVNAPLPFPDSWNLIIDCMEGQQKVLPANLHRIYFNILIEKRLYDKFFILATSVAQPLIGYEFCAMLTTLMEDIAFPQLKSFIEDNSTVNQESPWEVSRFIAASLTVINIVENCVYLPICLETSLPGYLKVLTARLHEAFKQMCVNPKYVSTKGFMKGGGIIDAKRQVENILNQITKIRELKRSNTVFFEELVVKFVEMLQSVGSSH